MKRKVQERLDLIEENLDYALSKLCQQFNKAKYLKILKAYDLMGKLPLFVDQLNFHFVNTINNVSIKTVLTFIDTSETIGDELKFKKYADLCEVLNLKTNEAPSQNHDFDVVLSRLARQYERLSNMYKYAV
jgi:hypothetical protein